MDRVNFSVLSFFVAFCLISAKAFAVKYSTNLVRDKQNCRVALLLKNEYSMKNPARRLAEESSDFIHDVEIDYDRINQIIENLDRLKYQIPRDRKAPERFVVGEEGDSPVGHYFEKLLEEERVHPSTGIKYSRREVLTTWEQATTSTMNGGTKKIRELVQELAKASPDHKANAAEVAAQLPTIIPQWRGHMLADAQRVTYELFTHFQSDPEFPINPESIHSLTIIVDEDTRYALIHSGILIDNRTDRRMTLESVQFDAAVVLAGDAIQQRMNDLGNWGIVTPIDVYHVILDLSLNPSLLAKRPRRVPLHILSSGQPGRN